MMRRSAAHLPSEVDRRAANLRASAIEDGYSPSCLEQLSRIVEDITIFAGRLSTWYGKEAVPRPTAFGCRLDVDHQSAVTEALDEKECIGPYLRGLHPDLRIGQLPSFAATRVFFMAGEGNLHPKHIAYFLPEDEGIKRSSFKKTYYFRNTHEALIEHAGAPLSRQFLDPALQLRPNRSGSDVIPTLGVLGHEIGHAVHRPATDYSELNSEDRWASVALQETAADVYGILIVAELWAEHLALSPDEVIAYYLSECLRYVDRGLGHFPDSDGMLFQLNYFRHLGALTLKEAAEPRLVAEPGTIVAALRSLARVLADTVLAGNAGSAIALYREFGPSARSPLQPLIDALRAAPPKSVEYVQEYAR